MKNPDLSIILGHFNDADSCIRTATHLLDRADEDGVTSECIIVDNGSTNAEREKIHQFSKENHRVDAFDQPRRGPLHAHHWGFQYATGKYLYFPDCHIVTSPRFFSTLISTLEQDQTVGIASSCYASGTHIPENVEIVDGMRAGDMFRGCPFGKEGAIGMDRNDGKKDIASTEMSALVLSRAWFSSIGEMFQQDMLSVGGYVAESFLTCLTTWMFGKRVVAHSDVAFFHYGYLGRPVPSGVIHDLGDSVLYAANILDGTNHQRCLDRWYGLYDQDLVKRAYEETASARAYVQKNKVYDLRSFVQCSG